MTPVAGGAAHIVDRPGGLFDKLGEASHSRAGDRCARRPQIVLAEHELWCKGAPIPDAALDQFGELVARAAQPIDDVRGTARYRHHALGVLGRRTLTWVWEEYRCG